MSPAKHMIAILALLTLVNCGEPATEPQPEVVPPVVNPPVHSATATRIIFVGNSLTSANNVPWLVVELGKMDNREIAVETYAPGGFSLEDHWNAGAVQLALQRGGFDFFVGQQGPSSLPESLVLLKEYAELYANACVENDITFALYMVWPDKSRAAFHDAVISNYREAAMATNAVLCPAGLSWKEAWNENPNIQLYGADQFHPSMTGSVLAALSIYGALFKKDNFDFVEHEKMSWKGQVSRGDLEVLKRAVLKAIKQ